MLGGIQTGAHLIGDDIRGQLAVLTTCDISSQLVGDGLGLSSGSLGTEGVVAAVDDFLGNSGLTLVDLIGQVDGLSGSFVLVGEYNDRVLQNLLVVRAGLGALDEVDTVGQSEVTGACVGGEGGAFSRQIGVVLQGLGKSCHLICGNSVVDSSLQRSRSSGESAGGGVVGSYGVNSVGVTGIFTSPVNSVGACSGNCGNHHHSDQKNRYSNREDSLYGFHVINLLFMKNNVISLIQRT